MPTLHARKLLAAAFAVAVACLAPAGAQATTTGGVSPDDPEYRPAGKAKLVGGMAIPPRDAPRQVVDAINAANRIVGKPYKYGGGHAMVEDTGYDCSGTISYALLGAGLLKSPLDSTGFMSWGQRGRGKWITVYTNPGHAYVVIAGLRLDTSAAGERRSSGKGPRWRPVLRSTRGFKARHPKNL